MRSATPVSLTDVARRARTSPATVSRVLGGSSHPVAIETRARVVRAAEELGYRPNAIARALARSTTDTIGLIIGDVTDAYFADIACGVEDYARPRGVLPLLVCGDRNPKDELAGFVRLLDHRPRAILFAGSVRTGSAAAVELAEAVALAVRRGARVVTLAERGFEGVPVITVDNHALMQDITRHLIGLGCRRIACLDGPPGLGAIEMRGRGYREAMTAAGLVPEVVACDDFRIESGRRAALALLAGELPDAVIASSDEQAGAVMATLRAAGVEVPGRVAVVGVDGTPLSELLDLTTVSVPTYELGALGARIALEGGGAPRTVLSHRIVVRGSTARRTGAGRPRQPRRAAAVA